MRRNLLFLFFLAIILSTTIGGVQGFAIANLAGSTTSKTSSSSSSSREKHHDCWTTTSHSKKSTTTTSSSTSSSSSSPSSLTVLYESSSTASTQSQQQEKQQQYHIVDGIQCREIHIEVPTVGQVTVLEATAEAQSDLVDMALVEEDEDDQDGDHQSVLSSGDPYGAVLWPAAWAVSNYILNNSTITSEELSKLSILELGTGTGLVSIALALGGAKHVIATDYEPFALQLTQYAASTFHELSNLDTQLLDMCDLKNQPLPNNIDLVVAADIMYESKTGIAMAYRVVEALKKGCRVIVGDSPGRPGRPAFLKTLQEELGGSQNATFVDHIGKTCTGPRHDLICSKESTSVSETPQDLSVAIMDLHPNDFMTMLSKNKKNVN